MRRLTMLVVVMLVVAWIVPGAMATEEDTLAVVQDKLARVNALINEMLEQLNDGAYASVDAWNTDQAAIRDALADAVAAVPDVLGVPFAVWFQQLSTLGTALTEAEAHADADWPNTQTVEILIADAAAAKDHLEAQLREANDTEPCSQGTILLEFFVGQFSHDLQNAINAASAKGQCIDAVVRQPESTATSGLSSTELQARSVIAGMGRTDVRFVDAQTADDGTYVETYMLGDPTVVRRDPTPPTQPDAHFVDAALAYSVTAGVPDRMDPADVFDPGDPLNAWFRLSDVCGPLDWEWRLYDPDGYPAAMYSGAIDGPATGCYGSYSSSYPLHIEGPAFWVPGTYSAELWLDELYSYQTLFGMSGAVPRDPFSSDDVLRTPVDTPLGNLEARVLDNDADPNGDRLSTRIVRQPAHGRVYTNPDGSISHYDPEPGFAGVVTFDYIATDGVFDSLPATVTIHVGGEPHP